MTVDYERLTAAVIRLQNGEGKAFEEIYNLTNGPAYFTALKIAKNEDDAQDVLQDSYVKVLDKIGELEKPESFMSWFNIIVANTARNIKRKNNPALLDDFAPVGEEGEDYSVVENIADEDEFDIPGSELEKEELRRDIMAAIDELSDDKRAVIIMQYYNNMSIRDISYALEINENTVKSRIFQAKKTLAKSFAALEKKYGKLLTVAPMSAVRWALNFAEVSSRNTNMQQFSDLLEKIQAAEIHGTSFVEKSSGSVSRFLADIIDKIRSLFDNGIDPKPVAAVVVTAGIVAGGVIAGTRIADNRKETPTEPVSVSQTAETTPKPLIEPPTFDFDENKKVDNEVEVKELQYGVKGTFQAFSENGEVTNAKPVLDRKNFKASYEELLPAASENSVKFAGEIGRVLGAVESLSGRSLEADAVLSEQAGVRAEEIAWSARDYSIRPDGSDFTTVFDRNGITEGTRDEIIVYRAKSVDDALNELQKIDNAEKLNGSVRRIGIGAAEEPESGELVFVIHTVSSDVRPGDIFGQLRERIEYRNDTALDNQIDGITDTIIDIQALEERVADIPAIGDILLYDFNTDAFEKRSAERFDRFLERLDNILPR